MSAGKMLLSLEVGLRVVRVPAVAVVAVAADLAAAVSACERGFALTHLMVYGAQVKVHTAESCKGYAVLCQEQRGAAWESGQNLVMKAHV